MVGNVEQLLCIAQLIRLHFFSILCGVNLTTGEEIVDDVKNLYLDDKVDFFSH